MIVYETQRVIVGTTGLTKDSNKGNISSDKVPLVNFERILKKGNYYIWHSYPHLMHIATSTG